MRQTYFQRSKIPEVMRTTRMLQGWLGSKIFYLMDPTLSLIAAGYRKSFSIIAFNEAGRFIYYDSGYGVATLECLGIDQTILFIVD